MELFINKNELFQRVMDLMGWSKAKTMAWFKTDNLNFGGFSPNTLIQRGKIKKVEEFIEDAEQSNKPNLGKF